LSNAVTGKFGSLTVALIVLALASCMPVSFAPRGNDQTVRARHPDFPTREVVAGDTLYSIAWEAGHDYRELAKWNDIPPPYLIRPGQTLRLNPPDTASKSAPVPAAPQAHTVRKGETLYHIALTYDVEVDDLAQWNDIPPPYLIKPGQRLRLLASSTPDGARKHGSSSKTASSHRVTSTRASRPAARATGSARAAASAGRIAASHIGGWIWPTEGVLLERFGSTGSKGIDLGGRRGQAIRAANEGEVVYQGGGLRGYGQLIIVKHSAEFLSAYAHCNRIYVKEGDVIRRGQKIADMGSSGTDRPMLHFEIRYRGTPVDPLRYLPKK
jgi:lipoprotein NlpD